jgi:hypothetical protein
MSGATIYVISMLTIFALLSAILVVKREPYKDRDHEKQK